MEKQLRSYQEDIVKRVIKSDLDLLVCLPTGSGKTVIANAIMQQLDGLCVFVVPRLELIKQANDEFENVDIIWSDKTQITDKHVIVSSKDSLRTQYNKIPDIHPLTLIFDEVHIGIEQTHKLVDMIKPDRVLGLTATPERMDGMALTKGINELHKFGVFDDVIVAETVPTLINKGFLTPLEYYTKPIDGITKIKSKSASGDELTGSQMKFIFDKNKIWGDLVECYEKYNPDMKPAIGFTTTIEMAQMVCNVFKSAGYDFRVISGEMSTKERRKLLDALKNGDLDGLVNAALLTYGFDCPEVYYAFSCRHIKSRPLWFQMIGRVLRISEGKDKAIFVDHGDSLSEFATPNCALPIMDPFIQWRYNGFTKEEKAQQLEESKQFAEIIKRLNVLDPRPVNMVQVTSENLYTRVIRKLDEAIKIQEQANKLEQKAEQLSIENQNLRKSQGPRKIIDKEKTFQYIKSNYCRKRQRYERIYPGNKLKAHEMTVQSFKDDEARLPFYYETGAFESGMKYWKNRIDRDGFRY